MRRFATIALLLVLATAAAASSQADQDQALAREIDTMLRAAYPADAPGATVIVMRDGRTVLREGYGLADLELQVPMAPDMVLRIGSVTKQFTAVAILMLEQEGKLALTDRIETFLPDYPTHGLTITIEHLLTHTSGIQSYTDQAQFGELIRKDYTVSEMIDRFKDDPMLFAPGSRWVYNNAGYFLLGAIIEQVTGETWAAFLQRRIFDVAGMATTFADRHERVIPRRVPGYEPDPDGGWRQAAYLSMTQPYAAGAMLSTVDDLARWDAALRSGRLIDAATLQRAWTEYLLLDGGRTGYGYGWVVGQWQGSRLISHGGGINGFLSETICAPDERVFVAILTNSAGGPSQPSRIATEIALLAMGKPWRPQEVAVEPEVLQRYAGVYRIDPTTTRTVIFEDGKLFTQRSGAAKLQARPMSPTAFFYEGSFSHFTIDLAEDGTVRGMTMRALNSEPEFARLTDEQPVVLTAITLDPDSLDRYLGRYELAPSFVITVTRQGDQLVAQATGQPAFEIFPLSPARFFLKVVEAQIEFDLPPGDGPATGLTLFQSGRVMPASRLAD